MEQKNLNHSEYSEVKFNVNKDLEQLNLNSSDYYKVKQILDTYISEAEYWKIKHERLLKKIKDIVCY
jgi:ribosomal protein S18